MAGHGQLPFYSGEYPLMAKRSPGKRLDLSIWRIVPAVAWVVLPTLIVRGHFTPVLAEAGHLWESAFYGDTRAWWKAVFVCGIGMWMLAHLLIRLLAGWRPHCRRFAVLLGVAALSTGISTFFSPFPQTSWLGYTSFYEGAAVLFSYLVAAWYVAEMVDTDASRLLLIRVVGGIGLLNGCHGIAEGFGWHFWRSDLGLWLMGANRDDVIYQFTGSRMAYGTVFQPNHYGMLMAMLGALALGMVFADRSRGWRIFWVGTFFVAAAGIFFSNSRAGALTFLGITVVFIGVRCIQAWRAGDVFQAIRKRLSGTMLIGIVLGCAVVALFFTASTTRNALGRLAERSRAWFYPMTRNPEILTVGLSENRIRIRLADEMLVLGKRLPNTWMVSREGETGRGTELVFRPKGKKWHEAPIPGVTDGFLSYRNEGNVRLTAPDTTLDFYAIGASLWAIDPGTKLAYAELPMSPYPVSGREGFLSGRGFLWSRLWSMIREHPLFGTGPGTFALVFPNQYFLDKMRFSFGQNADKGHGIWAMFAVQLGIVGLLAYCLPVGYAVSRTFRQGAMLRTPILLGMSAYLICALTNDSTVGVTPIFCALVGIGLSEATGSEDKRHAALA